MLQEDLKASRAVCRHALTSIDNLASCWRNRTTEPEPLLREALGGVAAPILPRQLAVCWTIRVRRRGEPLLQEALQQQ